MRIEGFIPPTPGDFEGVTVATMIGWMPAVGVGLALVATLLVARAVHRRSARD
ncbi:MAG: hypothetical protein GX593_02380 [Actinomycetales bacterium]|nr:hypothetical protein [Actinomycetales bacterium]